MKRVFWLDDHSPDKAFQVEGVDVHPFNSCGALEDCLNTESDKPDWVIVDLIVPQGSWGKNQPLKTRPGIHYLGHLRDSHSNRVRVAVFSNVLDQDTKREVVCKGADLAFGKNEVSLEGLLDKMRAYE